MNTKPYDCRCRNWARTDTDWQGREHHPNCEHYRAEEPDRSIIEQLVRGIECWASDEDGVHDAVWAAYMTAKNALGEEVKEEYRS